MKYLCKECFKEKEASEMRTERCCKECWKPYMKDLDFNIKVDTSEYWC